MSKGIKKFASAALPLVSLIPGVGTALGPLGMAALGAAGGAIGGGGLKGALLGGLGSYVGSGGLGGTAVGNALGNTGTKVLGGALSGLGGDGGLKGALLGAGGGLASSLLSGGGITADKLNAAKPTSVAAGATMPASTGLSGLSSYIKPASALFSAYNDMSTADEMEKLIQERQRRNQKAVSPYAQSGYQANQQLTDRLTQGFTAPDLQNDPGYQFQLAEGQKAMDRASSARGGYYSGAALRDAGKYATGLADTTYNDAYNRWLQQNAQLGGQAGQGLNATGAITGYGDTSMMGQGLALQTRKNALNQALARLMGNDEELRREMGA